jgi:hypothetical protein
MTDDTGAAVVEVMTEDTDMTPLRDIAELDAEAEAIRGNLDKAKNIEGSAGKRLLKVREQIKSGRVWPRLDVHQMVRGEMLALRAAGISADENCRPGPGGAEEKAALGLRLAGRGLGLRLAGRGLGLRLAGRGLGLRLAGRGLGLRLAGRGRTTARTRRYDLASVQPRRTCRTQA